MLNSILSKTQVRPPLWIKLHKRLGQRLHKFRDVTIFEKNPFFGIRKLYGKTTFAKFPSSDRLEQIRFQYPKKGNLVWTEGQNRQKGCVFIFTWISVDMILITSLFIQHKYLIFIPLGIMCKISICESRPLLHIPF